MSIDKLPVFEEFSAEKDQGKIVLWIKTKIFAPISRRINWLLDRIKDDSFQITAADAVIDADGNWQELISGTDFLIQRRESGAWVTKATVLPSGFLVAGTFDINGTTAVVGILDEDDMVSDSATNLITQQSIKAYVDTLVTLDANGVLMHDAEGGFNNMDVDGTKTKVFTKYFTGTTDGDSTTTVAHGITGIDNILSVVVVVFSTNTSNYQAAEVGGAASAVNKFTPRFDGTNVIIDSVGSAMQSQKYRLKLDYVL